MKKLFTIVAIAIGVYFAYAQHPSATPAMPVAAPVAATVAPTAESLPAVPAQNSSALDRAAANHLSNIRVQGSGRVTKVLPDDNDGSRHQRFIVRLDSGQRILIAHNIDLAPRVSALNAGDAIEFGGEYVWNAKGGVVHWTHHDPAGRHPSGWLKHNGQMIQ